MIGGAPVETAAASLLEMGRTTSEWGREEVGGGDTGKRRGEKRVGSSKGSARGWCGETKGRLVKSDMTRDDDFACSEARHR